MADKTIAKTQGNAQAAAVAAAKGFLLRHSRVVKAGIYFNKFNPYGVKEGLNQADAKAVFQNVLEGHAAAMAEETGYTVSYANARFLLCQDGMNDPAGMFTGEQMKLSTMTPEMLGKHEAVVRKFDEVCNSIVAEYTEAVTAGTEEAVEETEETEAVGA